MNRLDELLALRRQLDSEIELERAAVQRIRTLRKATLRVMSRATWNDRTLDVTCTYVGVDPAHVRAGHRGKAVTEARHVAMWLMYDAGRTYPEIGAHLGMDHTSARHGVLRVSGDSRLLSDARAIREHLTGEPAAAPTIVEAS